MGYSPIRQFEALIPLYLRESRRRAGAEASTVAATAYHVAYWLAAGFGNPTYAKLAQGHDQHVKPKCPAWERHSSPP